MKAYKLTKEIEQFIINRKKTNPTLSCRGLIPLIREHFQVSLSKSLINKVIKQNNLSNPAGRRGIIESVIVRKPAVVQGVKKKKEFIENGGCFFLKAADLKLSLTSHLAKNFLVYLPNFSEQTIQSIIMALMFMPLFKNKQDLWMLIDEEVPEDRIEQYLAQLAKIPISELNKALTGSVIRHNINQINELHKHCLQRLSNYVQSHFFPSAYQFLDFPLMRERFYSLWATMEKADKFLEIRFFYPKGFPWQNDIVWLEDLSYAANKVNMSRIFTQKGQLQVNFRQEILPVSPINTR